MPWKPEYAQTRKKKAKEDPEYRKKRNEQSCKDKEARKQYNKSYYQNNRDKFRVKPEHRDERNRKRREQYASNPELQQKLKADAKKWRESNPQKAKRIRIRKYGLSYEQFEQMVLDQGGKCAICGYSDRKKPLFFPVIDHCHKTGKVRGLLCMNCNQGLGRFKDNATFLKNAIAYLHKNLAALAEKQTKTEEALLF